jgi:hypothetical protein
VPGKRKQRQRKRTKSTLAEHLRYLFSQEKFHRMRATQLGEKPSMPHAENWNCTGICPLLPENPWSLVTVDSVASSVSGSSGRFNKCAPRFARC